MKFLSVDQFFIVYPVYLTIVILMKKKLRQERRNMEWNLWWFLSCASDLCFWLDLPSKFGRWVVNKFVWHLLIWGSFLQAIHFNFVGIYPWSNKHTQCNRVELWKHFLIFVTLGNSIHVLTQTIANNYISYWILTYLEV